MFGCTNAAAKQKIGLKILVNYHGNFIVVKIPDQAENQIGYYRDIASVLELSTPVRNKLYP